MFFLCSDHTYSAIVLEDSSEEHDDNLQMQDDAGHAAAEIISASPKPRELGRHRQKRRMRPAGAICCCHSSGNSVYIHRRILHETIF